MFHERRDTFSGFGRQMYKYGRGRGQLMVRTPATVSPAYPRPVRAPRVRRVAADRRCAHPRAHARRDAGAARGLRRSRRDRRRRDRGDAPQAHDAATRRRARSPSSTSATARGAARPHRTPATARRARRVGVDRRDGRGRADPGAGRTGVNGSSARPTGAPVIVLDGVSEVVPNAQQDGLPPPGPRTSGAARPESDGPPVADARCHRRQRLGQDHPAAGRRGRDPADAGRGDRAGSGRVARRPLRRLPS